MRKRLLISILAIMMGLILMTNTGIAQTIYYDESGQVIQTEQDGVIMQDGTIMEDGTVVCPPATVNGTVECPPAAVDGTVVCPPATVNGTVVCPPATVNGTVVCPPAVNGTHPCPVPQYLPPQTLMTPGHPALQPATTTPQQCPPCPPCPPVNGTVNGDMDGTLVCPAPLVTTPTPAIVCPPTPAAQPRQWCPPAPVYPNLVPNNAVCPAPSIRTNGIDTVGVDGAPVGCYDLSVRVTDIQRRDRGQVIIALFSEIRANGFTRGAGFPWRPHEALMTTRANICPDGTAVACFPNLPAGNYVVMAYHDINGDGVIDLDIDGIPLEGYAISGNQRRTAQRPRFDEAAFTLNQNRVSVVRMQYSPTIM